MSAPPGTGRPLFGNAGRQALSDSAASFGRKLQLPKETTAKLQADVSAKIGALAGGLGLSPSEMRELTGIVLNTAVETASGRHTSADTERLSAASLADLKSRHVSKARVQEVLAGTNAWLKTKHPEIHAALSKSPLGSHPWIVRRLTERHLADQEASQRANRAAKWVGKARGAAAPASAPAAKRGLFGGATVGRGG